MNAFSPCVDGLALPRDPFDPDAAPLSSSVPMMVGTNKDETTLSSIWALRALGSGPRKPLTKRAATAAFGDKVPAVVAALRAAYPDYSPTHLVCAVQTVAMMWADSVTLAERKAAQEPAPAYMYMMTWETPVARGSLRSPHALEIPLVFDNVEAARNFRRARRGAQQMADQMAPAWLAFARSGNPATAALPTWPAYDLASSRAKDDDLRPGEPDRERSARRGPPHRPEPVKGPATGRPTTHATSKTMTERAIWPVFISVKASFTSSSLIRREIISSSLSLPARYMSTRRGMSTGKWFDPMAEP